MWGKWKERRQVLENKGKEGKVCIVTWNAVMRSADQLYIVLFLKTNLIFKASESWLLYSVIQIIRNDYGRMHMHMWTSFLIMAFATLAPPITGGWNQAYSHDISSSKLTVEWVLIGQWLGTITVCHLSIMSVWQIFPLANCEHGFQM